MINESNSVKVVGNRISAGVSVPGKLKVQRETKQNFKLVMLGVKRVLTDKLVASSTSQENLVDGVILVLEVISSLAVKEVNFLVAIDILLTEEKLKKLVNTGERERNYHRNETPTGVNCYIFVDRVTPIHNSASRFIRHKQKSRSSEGKFIWLFFKRKRTIFLQRR